ncbi:CocE/NonD family hydrolase [Balneatrix alpica]|uniref:CocE/NonD family hydrolase n=1 Tax=Balneatrix alpica TaxID=75684 RepID=A0ABV5ZD34_9GAMM|nr:CocE/NonD family hydrolase [Balneatrix alpica]
MHTQDATAPQQDIQILRSIMVPMRDGIRLATDIYLPGSSHQQPWPVILERTPYGKQAISQREYSRAQPTPLTREQLAKRFAAAGFAVVMQDCRGRYESEGEFSKYINEAEDGYDTLEWITQQPWCNGKIGMTGMSYAAHTQLAAACLNPPGLACMFMDSGGFANAYQAGIRQGGAFELKQVTWAYRHALASPEAQNDPVLHQALAQEDLRAWFSRLPWKPGHSPLRWHPQYEQYLFKQWQSINFDEQWQRLGLWAEGYYQQCADVPTFMLCSWYDPYAGTIPANFIGLSQHHRGPYYMAMGPWIHGSRSEQHAGEVDFGHNAVLDGQLAEDYFQLRLNWFRRWLFDEQPAWSPQTPKVQYFRMGGGPAQLNDKGHLQHGGEWLQSQQWPPEQLSPLQFYLSSQGNLSHHPEPQASLRQFRFDPSHPVPAIGGAITSGAPLMEGGAFNQVEREGLYGCTPPYLPLSSRADVLIFETEPLQRDLEVTGPVEVQLWISSDCPDTDFTAKLVDVYPSSSNLPQGYAMNLCDGIMRARFHSSWQQPSLLEPGKCYPLTLQLMPTSNLFKSGHRLRLEISSSKFPHFDVNPNTGENPVQASHWRVALNRVHLGGHTPSRLQLWGRYC